MIIEINEFNIEIVNDPMYTPNSSDNKFQYDEVFGSKECISSKHGIVLSENDDILRSIIILETGGATGIHENCYIIIDQFLYLCVGNKIYKIQIPELSVIWSVEIDMATAFQIKQVHEDLIIHGELSISRLTQNGEIIWTRTGSDIFITESGENDFKIEGDLILAESWDGRRYSFNFDGS